MIVWLLTGQKEEEEESKKKICLRIFKNFSLEKKKKLSLKGAIYICRISVLLYEKKIIHTVQLAVHLERM